MRHADIAMYQLKEQGPNAFRFYEKGMIDAPTDRMNLENSLRRAIQNHESELYYQAEICAKTHQATDAEVLLPCTFRVAEILHQIRRQFLSTVRCRMFFHFRSHIRG